MTENKNVVSSGALSCWEVNSGSLMNLS